MPSSKTLLKLNLWLTVLWLLLIIPTLIWWKDSILWVAMMSIWANVASHFAAYIAGRAEEAQKKGHNLTQADMDWISTALPPNQTFNIINPPTQDIINPPTQEEEFIPAHAKTEFMQPVTKFMKPISQEETQVIPRIQEETQVQSNTQDQQHEGIS